MAVLQLTEIYPMGKSWQVWELLAPGTTPFADLLKTETWAHLQSRPLGVRDTIHVKSEAGLYTAELEVERVFIGGATMRVIHLWEAPVSDEAGALKGTGFKIGWGSPSQKFRITDGASGDVLKSGFNTKADALAAIPALIAERSKA